MWSYRQVFKTLTDMTNTKLSTIAYILDYDISYISKWNSGKKLPSYKNIYIINGKLATLFSKALIEENKINEFLLFFNLKSSEILKTNEERGLEFLIYKLLNDSYNYTNSDVPAKYRSNTNFIFRNHNADDDIKKIFKKIIFENNELDIWATFDIYSQYANLLFNITKKTKNKKIKLHLLCDKKNLQDKNILKSITDNSNVEIELYENSNVNYNYLLVKDKMYIVFNNDAQNLNTITYGNELDTLLEFSSYIDNLFNELNKIITISSPEEIAKTNYRKYFYSDNEFLFLSNYGFEFLLPNYIIDKILNSISDKFEYKKSEILNIKLIWDELFADSNINFLTTKTSLLNYFETGDMLYCSTKAKLSYKDREAHFKNIINVMKNNKKINFYIINDNRFISSLGLDQFNFFISENNMFFKKILSEDSNTPTSIVSDTKIHNNMCQALEEIMRSPYSKKYSVEELEKTFSKYAEVFKKISNNSN